MRFSNYLSEVYFTSLSPPYKGGKSSFEVFKNPDRKEITDLWRQYKDGHSGIRFYINLKKKDVYIFYGDMMHHSFATKMKIDFENTDWLSGEGEYNNGKIDILGIANEVPEEDKKWLSKYFNNL